MAFLRSTRRRVKLAINRWQMNCLILLMIVLAMFQLMKTVIGNSTASSRRAPD